MVEVFKTNIKQTQQANHLMNLIQSRFPDYQVNFDLQDCDNILRVAAEEVCIKSVTQVVSEEGFFVERLD